MKNLILIFSTLVSLTATPIVIYNTNTFRVVQYIPRGSTPKFEGRNDVLVIAPATETNIFLPKIDKGLVPTNFFAHPLHFTVTNLTNIVAISQDVLNSETAAAQSNAVVQAEQTLRYKAKAAVTNLGPVELRIRAADLVLLQRINRIGSSNGVPAMTPAQFINAVKQAIDDKSAD